MYSVKDLQDDINKERFDRKRMPVFVEIEGQRYEVDGLNVDPKSGAPVFEAHMIVDAQIEDRGVV